jgi:3-hydroxypropanoate dehydrogenase
MPASTAISSPEPTSNLTFLCNLGYGDGEKLFPRLPRFDFDEMAKII